VIDRVRLFLNRPLRDGDRPRLFAVTVAVILGVTGILALLDDAGPAPRRDHSRPSAAAAAPTAGAVSIASTPTPAAPSEESNVPTHARRTDIARARRAARRFLRGYLPYSYGHRRASSIAATTPGLRAQLARERPRVPSAERRRHPRVELLQTDGVNRERAALLALVRDGKRRYSVGLQLANTPAGWLVTGLER
jgi:hypothetical protein